MKRAALLIIVIGFVATSCGGFTTCATYVKEKPAKVEKNLDCRG